MHRPQQNSLHDLDQLAQSILRSTADCIKVLDLDCYLEYFAPSACHVLECDDLSKLIGKYWPDFFQGSDREALLAAVAEAKNGRYGRFQGFCPTFAGTPKWWDVVVAPIFADDGSVSKLLAISRDITPRISAEQDARRLASMLEATSDFVGIARMNGELVFMNPAGRRMVGIPERANLAQYARDALTPEWVRVRTEQEWIPQALRDGSCRGEGAVLRPDGTEIPVSFVLLVHRDGNGQPEFISTIARDVSAEKATENALRINENALRISEQRLRLAHQAARLVSWELDLDTEVFTWSDDATRIFGATVPASYDDLLAMMYYSGDRENARRALKLPTSKQGDFALDFRIRDHAGNVRSIIARGQRYFNLGSQLILGVLMDAAPVETSAETRPAAAKRAARR
jgi:PAS domain S-box-containing protein